MRLGKKSFVLAAAVVLLLISAVPVLAAEKEPVELVVQNRTGSAVELTLKGPSDLVVTVEPKPVALSDAVLVEPGEYVYEYSACGKFVRRTIMVSETGATLSLAKCVTLARVNIDNNTGDPFFLSLIGAQNYTFLVPAEGLDISVVYGGYAYSSNACGLAEIGTLKASAALGQPLIWAWSCSSPSTAAVSLTPTLE